MHDKVVRFWLKAVLQNFDSVVPVATSLNQVQGKPGLKTISCDQLCDQFRIKTARNRAEQIDSLTLTNSINGIYLSKEKGRDRNGEEASGISLRG